MRTFRFVLSVALVVTLGPVAATRAAGHGAHRDHRGNLARSRAAMTDASRRFDAAVRPPEILDSWEGPLDYAHPRPTPVSLEQPDGSSFGAHVRPREIGGGLETLSGHTVVRDARGWWTYARARNGRLVPSRLIAGREEPRGIAPGIGRTESIWIDADGGDVRAQIFAYLRARSAAQQAAANAVGEPRIWKVPVLMVETNGAFGPGSSAAGFERRLSGYGTNPTGSMTESYDEMSYGKFQVDVDVFGPFTSPISVADPCFYGNTHPVGGIVGSRGMAIESVPQADPAVDFGEYDNDNDGFVDFLVLLHSGPDASATGEDCHTWSHFAPRVGDVPIMVTTDRNDEGEPVMVGNTMTIPEVNLDIGVAAHEMMHALGEPDYYDTGYGSAGTGDWDLGAGGSWFGDPPGSNPMHFNPMIKINQRWVTPRVIRGTTEDLRVRPRETDPDIFLLPMRVDSELAECEQGAFGYEDVTGGFLVDERCIVEGMLFETVSRSVPGAMFDRYALGTGLLIWHYDLTRWSQGGNNEPGPYMMDLEEFDARDDTQDLFENLSRGDPMDVWADDVVGISSATGVATDEAANTRLNSGETSGWAIGNIRAAGGEAGSAAAEFSDGMTIDVFRHTARTADLSPDLVRVPRGEVAQAGRRVSLSTVVYNHGGRDVARGVVARFLADGQEFARRTLGRIDGYGRARVKAPWRPTSEGVHRITVEIVAPDGVRQTSELNDRVTTSIEAWPGSAAVLVVDDDDGFASHAAYTGPLRALGIPFAVAQNHATSRVMRRFDAVIWETAAARYDGQLDPEDRAGIEGYLEHGGNLWLSGPSVAKALAAEDESAGGVDPDFFTDWFGAEFVDYVQRYAGEIVGADEVIGAEARYVLDVPHGRTVGDILALGDSPHGPSAATFTMPSLGDAVVGVRLKGEAGQAGFRTAFTSFDLTQIPDGVDRVALARRVLGWFGIEPGTPEDEPAIEHAARRVTRAWRAQPVIATVTGDPADVLLHFREHGTERWTTLRMQERAHMQFESEIPAWEVTPAGVEYWIDAGDVRAPTALPYMLAAGPAAKTRQARNPTPLPEVEVKPKRVERGPLPATGVAAPFAFALAALALAAAGAGMLRQR